MEKEDLNFIVNRLNGIVGTVASVDGIYNESIAEAFIERINFEDISTSLTNLYQNITEKMAVSSAGKYEFEKAIEISGKDIHSILEKQFLMHPFAISGIKNIESVKNTRFNIVFSIIELIRIAREGSNCCLNYRSRMRWIRSEIEFVGFMYIFPIGEYSIMLKIISKKQKA